MDFTTWRHQTRGWGGGDTRAPPGPPWQVTGGHHAGLHATSASRLHHFIKMSPYRLCYTGAPNALDKWQVGGPTWRHHHGARGSSGPTVPRYTRTERLAPSPFHKNEPVSLLLYYSAHSWYCSGIYSTFVWLTDWRNIPHRPYVCAWSICFSSRNIVTKDNKSNLLLERKH